MASSAAASTTPIHGKTAGAEGSNAVLIASPATVGRGHQQTLADTGFDGMAVAAIGTGLASAGWLVMLVGSRQLRRRSR
jgi:hypothetical protein